MKYLGTDLGRPEVGPHLLCASGRQYVVSGFPPLLRFGKARRSATREGCSPTEQTEHASSQSNGTSPEPGAWSLEPD
jgi:hypothetical protein